MHKTDPVYQSCTQRPVEGALWRFLVNKQKLCLNLVHFSKTHLVYHYATPFLQIISTINPLTLYSIVYFLSPSGPTYYNIIVIVLAVTVVVVASIAFLFYRQVTDQLKCIKPQIRDVSLLVE